jgi:hypothetical protein
LKEKEYAEEDSYCKRHKLKKRGENRQEKRQTREDRYSKREDG